jgi:hypothetical protein
MTNGDVSPKQAVIFLMKGAAPERADEIDALWTEYHPAVVLVDDATRVTLKADKDHIEFDAKTMDVFWLIGFAGWKAIECYSPLVICSAATGEPVADLIEDDNGLPDVERSYKERRAAAQTLIDAKTSALAPWPDDLPRPSADRDAFADDQYKVAYDLTCLAVAFTLFHEFRHVTLEFDDMRPSDLREEEIACDVWGREFMTVKLKAYAEAHGHNYHEVLRKRSMGLALAALILHEITPVWDHGGNRQYFAVADRLHALLEDTPLPGNDHFWIFAASLLIGIFRQKHIPIDAPLLPAADLARYLIGKL